MSKTPRTDDQAIRIMFGMLDTVVPVEFARQLETELADKDKQLAEAKAEIERLKSEHEDALRRAKDNAVSLSGAVTEYANELLAKDKLIEQMREALKAIDKIGREAGNARREDALRCFSIAAAALAAEGGE